MELTLHTETVIDSCHHLKGYEGNCARVHGHSSLVRMWFKGQSKYKNKVGILVDFNIVKEIKNKLDHRDLNEILKINPTAENMAEYIYYFIKKQIHKKIKVKVRYYETAVKKETYCECGDF